ncbi:MAG: hypothetical protein AB7T06_44230 [Kofleriaceae bacterium]
MLVRIVPRPPRIPLAILTTISLAGCHERQQSKIRWREKKSTALHVGTHAIPIPAGWRDWAELDVDELRPGPGMFGMTPENMTDGALRTNIIITQATLADGEVDPRNPPCEAMAKVVASENRAKVTDVATIPVAGDIGCRWTYVSDEARVIQRVRFHGNEELVVQWTRMRSLSDAEATGDQRVWRGVLTELGFKE